jgi:hypothetical protein
VKALAKAIATPRAFPATAPPVDVHKNDAILAGSLLAAGFVVLGIVFAVRHKLVPDIHAVADAGRAVASIVGGIGILAAGLLVIFVGIVHLRPVLAILGGLFIVFGLTILGVVVGLPEPLASTFSFLNGIVYTVNLFIRFLNGVIHPFGGNPL